MPLAGRIAQAQAEVARDQAALNRLQSEQRASERQLAKTKAELDAARRDGALVFGHEHLAQRDADARLVGLDADLCVGARAERRRAERRRAKLRREQKEVVEEHRWRVAGVD